MGARGARAGLIAAVAGAALAPEPALGADDPLTAITPDIRYDRGETLRATSVQTMLRRPGTRLAGPSGRTLAGGGPAGLRVDTLVPGRSTSGQHVASRPGGPPGPDVAYGRSVRGSDGRLRLQYWFFYEDNPQDRGIVRSGRHAGDWEMVQVRLGPDGRPDVVTAAQHSWAQRCDWSQTTHVGGHLVVFPAAASHATYLRAGDVHRPLGDPVDHARGRGRRVRPAVRTVTARRPGWMRWRGRWGAASAGIVPVEQSSPRGPAWQGRSWDDPVAFERSARPCGSGPPGRPWITAAVIVLAVLAAGLLAAVARAAKRLGPRRIARR